jgi:hypothetical protein
VRHERASGGDSSVARRHAQAGLGGREPAARSGASSTAKHRVAFRHEGRLLEPIAGQFLMDFSEREKV